MKSTDPKQLAVPAAALVLLVGPSGAGKTTFAVRNFARTEVVSSDACRALVSDDQNNMSVTAAAFRILHAIARERLRVGRLTVIDATNVTGASRRPLLAKARKFGRPALAVVFDLPVELCLERNRTRSGRCVPDDVVRRHHDQMVGSIEGLAAEGFDEVFVLRSAAAVAAVNVSSREANLA